MITGTNHRQPKILTGSALKLESFFKAMNNMACAAGLGAITGTLTRDYYQLAINALDQADFFGLHCSKQSSIETVYNLLSFILKSTIFFVYAL